MNEFIVKEIKGYKVVRRSVDGFFNATILLKQYNKLWSSDKKMDNYFNRYYTKTIIKSISPNTKSVYTKSKASRGRNIGTWMCPELFLNFVEYIDIELFIEIKEYFMEQNIISKEIKTVAVRDELLHLRNVKSAIDCACKDAFSQLQFQCCNGKYRLDFIFWRDTVYGYDDGDDEINRSVTIIEYDEKFHNNQISEDKNREIEVADYISKQIKKEGLIPYIEIIRIKKGQEGELYSYVIPYLTGVETSYTVDMINKTLDMRVLYKDEKISA